MASIMMSSSKDDSKADKTAPTMKLRIVSHPGGDAVIRGLNCVATQGFVSIKAYVDIDNYELSLTSGKWYYEVRLQTSGLMQIGWAKVKGFHVEGRTDGVGDDNTSWSYDGFREKVWIGDAIDFPGSKWSVDATIGCALDMNKKVITYYLNGEALAFPIFIDDSLSPGEGVVPAASLTSQPTRQSLTFAFARGDLKYMDKVDDDYEAIPDGLAAMWRAYAPQSPMVGLPNVDEHVGLVRTSSEPDYSDIDDDDDKLDTPKFVRAITTSSTTSKTVGYDPSSDVYSPLGAKPPPRLSAISVSRGDIDDDTHEPIRSIEDISLFRFMRACSTRDMSRVCRYIAKNRVDVNAIDNVFRYRSPSTRGERDFSFTALHWAARRGLVDIAQVLIKAGANVNTKSSFGRTPIMIAIENHRVEMVRYLLHVKALDPSIADYLGRNVAHYICDRLTTLFEHERAEKSRKRLEMIKELCTKHPSFDLDICDNYGRTPLMLASTQGLTGVVGYLIQKNVNVSYINEYGWTAYMRAKRSDPKTRDLVCSMLELAGARETAIASSKGRQAAYKVLRRRQNVAEELEKVFECKENPRVEDDEDSDTIAPVPLEVRFSPPGTKTKDIDANERDKMATPFIRACQLGNLDAVKWLVEHNANIFATDAKGRNGLMRAADNGCLDVVQYLLREKHFDVNYRDIRGMTPLHFALLSSTNTKSEMELMLLDEFKADVNLADTEHQQTALSYAVQGRKVEMVAKLLDMNVDVNDVNLLGQSAFHLACGIMSRGSAEKEKQIIELLVEKGKCDLNLRSLVNDTGLFTASIYGQWDMVWYLIEHGARVFPANNDNYRGINVLMRAILYDNRKARLYNRTDDLSFRADTVRKLLTKMRQSYGESSKEYIEMFECVDSENRTSLYYAIAANDIDAVHVLIEAHPDYIFFKTEDGRGVLHLVCDLEPFFPSEEQYAQKLRIAKFFVGGKNVPANSYDNLGRTPLVLAIRRGYTAIAHYLLSLNTPGHQVVSINSVNKRGDAAVVVAAFYKRYELVRWLVENAGADPASTTNDKRTPLEMAMQALTSGDIFDTDEPTNGEAARLITSLVKNIKSYPMRNGKSIYEDLAMTWIYDAYRTKQIEIAACLYGCRFVNLDNKEHLQIIRGVDFQDNDDVDDAFQQARAGILNSPNPVLAAIRMAEVSGKFAEIRPALRVEFNTAREEFMKLSHELLNDIESNDFMTALVLEQPVTDNSDDTMLDLALRSKNINFLRSARVDRIVEWWWKSTPFNARTLKSPGTLFRSPRVKFYMDVISFLSFLALYSWLLTKSIQVSDPVDDLEVVLLIYGLGYLFHELTQMTFSGYTRYSEDGWNSFDIVICILVIIVAICRTLGEEGLDGNDEETINVIYMTSMTLGALVMWTRALFLLTLFSPIFPLLLTVRKMMRDIFHFSALLVVILMGTFFAFTFLFGDDENGVDSKYVGSRNLLVLLFQNGLVGDPINDFADLPSKNAEVLSQLLASAFLFATAIILVNLLIAMMNSTYQLVTEASEYEFLFTQTQTRWRYDQAHNAVPPPFNLVVLVVYLCMMLPMKMFFTCRKWLTDNEAYYCPHCHRDRDKIRGTFSENFFYRRVYNDHGGGYTKYGDEYFWLDDVIDVNAFTHVDLNWLFLGSELEHHTRAESGDLNIMSDEQFRQQLIEGGAVVDKDDFLAFPGKMKKTKSYADDIDVKGFAHYGHNHMRSLIYADDLLLHKKLCICGRLNRSITGDRYIIEWLSEWMFIFCLYLPLVFAILCVKVVSRPFIGRAKKDDPPVPLRVRIMAARHAKKGHSSNPREMAYHFFIEWQHKYWQRVFRVFSKEFGVVRQLESYKESDPLSHSKSVQLETKAVSMAKLSEQITDLQDKIYERIQSIEKRLEPMMETITAVETKAMEHTAILNRIRDRAERIPIKET